ncbi:MAG: FAD-dependent oxidoreductase, partial [Pseudomonadota bacterium]|nr:FAD-dependent oxidoreductase [Pseudomonadota bacterium]
MHTEAQPAAPLHCDTVIVGGGAGGLELAARLGRKFGAAAGPEKLLLIDRSIIHIWKPSLHEVAVGTLNPQQEGLLYTALAQRNHFSFRLGELCGLDPEARTLDLAEWRDDEGVVVVPAMRIHFERCVLAIGSGSNSFGTPGFDKAFVLENVEQAQRFHRHLFGRFLQAANAEHRRLDVAIVGAGATGVELAAEMTEAHREFQTIVGRANRFALNIKLIEAAPRILSALSEKMSAHAVNILQDKQVEIFTSTQVGAIADHGIVTRSGQEIAADIVVWAAGIKAAEANRHFGLQTNAIHQFIVNDRLQTSAPAVYAMGDCAALEVQGVRVPATAQAA